jgi:phosphoglucan,water dikinase
MIPGRFRRPSIYAAVDFGKSDMKNEIRIGNQTSCSALSIMAPFEHAVSSSFDAFEWFPDKTDTGKGWTAPDLSKKERTRINETARIYDIRLSVHVPWQANPMNKDSRSLLADAVVLAEDIGASLVNIHLFNDCGPALYAKAVSFLLERLASFGIGLSIENTPLIGPTDINRLFDEFRRLGFMDRYQVGMCLDIGHANLCEETRNDYVGFLEKLDAQVPIAHVHLHENYGDADSHLLIFTGPAGNDDSGIRNLLLHLKNRGFTGSIILEQWPQPPSLLNRARDRLLYMIHDLEEKLPEPPRVKGKSEILESSSLEKEDDFAAEIARADRRFRSWRKKLAWILEYLENQSKVDVGHLAYLAVYFRFMGIGRISFGEDGGHYRPSHHARTARRIQELLSAMETPENVFVVRKIYPWLPSFDSAFTRAEPLTRIRDIAHRSDIPQELKREIKTSLQNKLHRSAGPEDLDTSGRLLERISSPHAAYPAAFIAEFRKFHEELREFFNARSLDEQLETLADGCGALSTLIRDYHACKENVETLSDQLSALHALSGLRAGLQEELKTRKGSCAQKLRVADIKLEDYGFVLLSRLANGFENTENRLPWGQVLPVIGLGVSNLRFSGLDAAECSAVENELEAWALDLDPQDAVQLIRIKATIERTGRLSGNYCDRILALFPQRVKRLGSLLGVAEHAIREFAEADIRSHTVFQLSRLVAVALRRIRIAASLPRWDVIVPGTAQGLLTEASGLDDLTASGDGAIMALLEKVEGYEEIPPGVISLIVARETPHLSHLAVRARESGTVFAVCEDRNRFMQLKQLAGQRLLLAAYPDKVEFRRTSGSETDQVPGRKNARKIHVITPYPRPLDSPRLLSLNQVTASACGGKAFAARYLRELALNLEAEFDTPVGVVIPFGVPEELIESSAASANRYRELLNSMNGTASESPAQTALELRSVIKRLRVPEEILSGIANYFPPLDRLMVRSSSNMEDLAALTGAGQHSSVANVAPGDVAAAVLEVWASLWTDRAIIGRRNLGIPQEKARMAVLIQSMLVPDKLSFIIHTINPVSFDRDEAYVELAVGMGDTLASARTPGTPYRIACRKEKGGIRILAFADFSLALWPGKPGELVGRTVDYSSIEFSRDKNYRQRLGFRLGRIARFVEDAMGRPQDIEGLISGETVYLVQSRPQQGRV